MVKLWYSNIHVDCIGRNEHKFRLMAAYEGSDDIVGYIDYTLVDDDMHVDFIFVNEEHRLKGIGRSLYYQLQLENHTCRLMESDFYTAAGLATRNSATRGRS